jgi:hypothetical protein
MRPSTARTELPPRPVAPLAITEATSDGWKIALAALFSVAFIFVIGSKQGLVAPFVSVPLTFVFYGFVLDRLGRRHKYVNQAELDSYQRDLNK